MSDVIYVSNLNAAVVWFRFGWPALSDVEEIILSIRPGNVLSADDRGYYGATFCDLAADVCQITPVSSVTLNTESRRHLLEVQLDPNAQERYRISAVDDLLRLICAYFPTCAVATHWPRPRIIGYQQFASCI